MGTKRLSLGTKRLGTKDPWVRNDWIPTLLSGTSRLGKTGESEFMRARKARVRSERKPRGNWGEGGKGG